jgi:hypothetical protein
MTMTSEPVFAPARLALLLQHFAEINHDRESWREGHGAKNMAVVRRFVSTSSALTKPKEASKIVV